MKSVPIAALPASDLAFTYEGGAEAAFVFAAAGEEAVRTVTVRTDGTALRFFPTGASDEPRVESCSAVGRR